MCESMKVKPGLCWRYQSHGIPAKQSSGLGVEPAQESRSEEHCGIRHGDEECGVCPGGFWSCFGPVFPHSVPFPSFGVVVYILCHCMLQTCGLLFDFGFTKPKGITIQRMPFESLQETLNFGLTNSMETVIGYGDS